MIKTPVPLNSAILPQVATILKLLVCQDLLASLIVAIQRLVVRPLMYHVMTITNVLKMDVVQPLAAGIHKLNATIKTIVLKILVIQVLDVFTLISNVLTLTLVNVLIVTQTEDVFMTIFLATIVTIVL
jgi:hypothetical protein